MATTTPEITRSSAHDPVESPEMVDGTIFTRSHELRILERKRWLPRLLLEGIEMIREHSFSLDGSESWNPREPRLTGALLPRYPGEKREEYCRRLSKTHLVPIFEESIEDLVSRILARDLVLSEDVPSKVQEIVWPNVDRSNTRAEEFLVTVFERAAAEGGGGILVDLPVGASVGDAPYWLHYPPEDILETTYEVVDGEPMLSRLRLRVLEVEWVGDFGQTVVEKVKIFERDDDAVSWKLYRKEEQGEGEAKRTVGVFEDGGDLDIGEIPFVEFPVGDGEPPLYALSQLQVQHLQKKSTLDNILDVANVPALLAAGFSLDEVKEQLEVVEWGPYFVFVARNPNAKLTVVEHAGTAMKTAAEDIDRLETQMRALGRQPTMSQATGREVATVRLLDEAKTLTRAQAWVIGWMSSATACLHLSSLWLGEEKVGDVSVSRDVFRGLARPASFEDLKELRNMREITSRTLLEGAKRYGVLWDDFDIDQEVEDLAAEAPPPTFGLPVQRLADAMPETDEDEDEDDEEDSEIEDEIAEVQRGAVQ